MLCCHYLPPGSLYALGHLDPHISFNLMQNGLWGRFLTSTFIWILKSTSRNMCSCDVFMQLAFREICAGSTLIRGPTGFRSMHITGINAEAI